MSGLYGDVLSLNVAAFAQSLFEDFDAPVLLLGPGSRERQHSYPRNFAGLLRLGGERRHEDAEGEHQSEQGRFHAPAFISASALSSQNPMSISRNIAVAVVRCSRACSLRPVFRYSFPRPR